jgi:hypothetical protein
MQNTLRRLLTSLTLFLCATAGICAGNSPWWDKAWKFRAEFCIATPPLTSGINSARAQLFFNPSSPPNTNDIRVIQRSGIPVPCNIIAMNSESATIEFQISSPSETTYYAYWGNPSAEPYTAIWEKKIGGLVLETKELSRRRLPWNLQDMEQLIATSKKSYGKGPRAMIDDLENPFGPNDFYISIYEGFIVCPETGEYWFATNSDDSSFFLIDNSMVVQWPGSHTKEGGANRPLANRWNHAGKKVLEKGVHTLRYLHAEGAGAQAARGAWKKPGETSFSLIPPSAFISYLYAAQLSLEEQAAPFDPFFEGEELTQFRFQKKSPSFVRYQFQDLTVGEELSSARRIWRYGKSSSSGSTLTTTFAAGKEYKVLLQVETEHGTKRSYSRTIRPQESKEAEDIRLAFDVLPNSPVADIKKASLFTASLRNLSSQELSLSLSTHPGSVQRPFILKPNEARLMEFSLIPTEPSLQFLLTWEGHLIDSREIFCLDTRSSLEGLSVSCGKLMKKGSPVLLLRSIPGTSLPLSSTKLHIAILGAPLANFGDTAWYHLFKGANNTVSFFPIEEEGSVVSPLAAIALAEQVAQQRPDIVFLTLGINELIRYDSPALFTELLKYLLTWFSSRNILPIAIVPPPLLEPTSSQVEMAVAIKTAALAEKVPSIDFFSIFPHNKNLLLPFYQSGNSFVSLRYPSSKGQRRMAEEVTAFLSQKYGYQP